MYAIYYTNFKQYDERSFVTVEEAIIYGRSKGFEFNVYDAGHNLIGYCTGVTLQWHKV